MGDADALQYFYVGPDTGAIVLRDALSKTSISSFNVSTLSTSD